MESVIIISDDDRVLRYDDIETGNPNLPFVLVRLTEDALQP